jgi:hypothetical protein
MPPATAGRLLDRNRAFLFDITSFESAFWIAYILHIVRHEAAQEMRLCWSLGVGLQDQAPKHLKLHW